MTPVNFFEVAISVGSPIDITTLNLCDTCRVFYRYRDSKKIDSPKPIPPPIQGQSRDTATQTTTTMTTHVLCYQPNNCFANAYINSRYGYKDLNLKLKMGSLAFNGWWEFGGDGWTVEKFKARAEAGPFGPRIDAHAWLEDDEGNVYDYAQEDWSAIAKLRTGKGLPYSGLLTKVSKADAARLGFTYQEAPKDAQVFMLCHVLLRVRQLEAAFVADIRKQGKWRAATK